MSGIVVEVSARKFTVPVECACCSQTPQIQLPASYTRVTGKRVIRETTRSLPFPYCNRCYEHVKAWNLASLITRAFMILGIVVGIAVAVSGRGGGGWVAFGGIWFAGLVLGVVQRKKARELCFQFCAAPHLAVHHLGWSGSVSSFSFDSPNYAAKFATGNGKKLVNVSMQLHQLMQHTGHQLPHGGKAVATIYSP